MIHTQKIGILNLLIVLIFSTIIGFWPFPSWFFIPETIGILALVGALVVPLQSPETQAGELRHFLFTMAACLTLWLGIFITDPSSPNARCIGPSELWFCLPIRTSYDWPSLFFEAPSRAGILKFLALLKFIALYGALHEAELMLSRSFNKFQLGILLYVSTILGLGLGYWGNLRFH